MDAAFVLYFGVWAICGLGGVGACETDEDCFSTPVDLCLDLVWCRFVIEDAYYCFKTRLGVVTNAPEAFKSALLLRMCFPPGC